MLQLSNTMITVLIVSAVFITIFSGMFYCMIWQPANADTSLPADKRYELRIGALTLLAQLTAGAIALPTLIWTVGKDQTSLFTQETAAANTAYSDALSLVERSDQSAIFAGFTSMGRIAKANPDFWPTLLRLATWRMTNGEAPKRTSTSDPYTPIPSGNQGAIDLVAKHTVSTAQPVASPSPCASFVNNPDVVDLNGAYLAGGRANGATGFAGAYFMGATLFGVDFRGANLTCAHFDGAQASDWRANGYGNGTWPDDRYAHTPDWQDWRRYKFIIDFAGADLSNAKFHNAALEGAVFAGSDVENADFEGANLSRADFRGARHVSAAKFSGACVNDPAFFDSGADPKLPACKTDGSGS